MCIRDRATFERLRAWRLAVAQRDRVPAYVVFTDATLVAIAESEPADQAALGRISGVGARKLERYGAAVLALVGGAAVADLLAEPTEATERTGATEPTEATEPALRGSGESAGQK